MRNLLDCVDTTDAVRWVNEAIGKNAKKIIVIYDDFSNEYYPHYLIDGEDEKEVVILFNKESMQKVECIVDIKAEVESALESGEAGIDYKKAGEMFPELTI